MTSYVFLGTKIPMLFTASVDGSPHLFYAKNICHLKALRHSFAVKNIVNSILSECTTHITMFYIIAVAAIHLINALSTQR